MENGFPLLAKILVYTGLFLLVGGLIVWGISRFTDFRSMPGDMVYKRENFTFYFPHSDQYTAHTYTVFLEKVWRVIIEKIGTT